MQVRDAELRDVEALAALKPGRALHRDRIGAAANGRLRYLVIEDGQAVLGFGVLVLEPPAGWPPVCPVPQALDLFVRPDRRSRGLGTFLIREIERVAERQPSPALFLCVDPEANARALALYVRLGYDRLDAEPVEDRWSHTDSDGVVHEGVEYLVRLRRHLPSTRTSLREHDVHLRDGALHLRPMTEADWPALLRWNQDPDVLFFAEGDEIETHTLEEIQQIYRGVSRAAEVFVVEVEGRPIGECWLQVMNLPRVLARFPWDARLQRIDMMIGEKDCWGRGYGTRALRLLLRRAFEHVGADAVFGCDVSASNPRSAHVVERLGFVPFLEHAAPKGEACDFVLTREAWEATGR